MESGYDYDGLGSVFGGASSSSLSPLADILGTDSHSGGTNPYDTHGGLQLAQLYNNPRHQHERESIGDILNRYQGQSRPSYQGNYDDSYEENLESHFGFDERGAHVGVRMSRTHQTPFGNARTDVGVQMSIGHGGLAIRTSGRTSFNGGGRGGLLTIGCSRGSRYHSPFGHSMFQPMGSMMSPLGGLFSPLGGMFSPALGSYGRNQNSSMFGCRRGHSHSQNQDIPSGYDGPIIEEMFDEEENENPFVLDETTAGSHLAIKDTAEEIDSSLGLGLLPDTDLTYSDCGENGEKEEGETMPMNDGILNDLAYSETPILMKSSAVLNGDIHSAGEEEDQSKVRSVPRFKESQMTVAEFNEDSLDKSIESPSSVNIILPEIPNTDEPTKCIDGNRGHNVGTREAERVTERGKERFTKQTFKNIPIKLKQEDDSLPFLRSSFVDSRLSDENQSDNHSRAKSEGSQKLMLNENSLQRKSKRETTNKNVFPRRRNDSFCSSSSEQDRSIDFESFESLTKGYQRSRSPQEVCPNPDKYATVLDAVAVEEQSSEAHQTLLTTSRQQNDTYCSSPSEQDQTGGAGLLECYEETYEKSEPPQKMSTNLDMHSKDLNHVATYSDQISEAPPFDSSSSNEVSFLENEMKHFPDTIERDCTGKSSNGSENDVSEKPVIDTNTKTSQFMPLSAEIKNSDIDYDSAQEQTEPTNLVDNGTVDGHSETELKDKQKDDNVEQNENSDSLSLKRNSQFHVVPNVSDVEMNDNMTPYKVNSEEKEIREVSEPSNNASDFSVGRDKKKRYTENYIPVTLTESSSNMSKADISRGTHIGSEVKPSSDELDKENQTTLFSVLVILENDDSQRHSDRPVTTFMSKENRKVEAGNRFMISYGAENPQKCQSMRQNQCISEHTEDDSDNQQNTSEVLTDQNSPQNISTGSVNDHYRPQTDTGKELVFERMTSQGNISKRKEVGNYPGHEIPRFQSESDLKGSRFSSGELPSILTDGGNESENLENKSIKDLKAPPQSIHRRGNLSDNILSVNKEYCREINWQYPGQVPKAHQHLHNDYESAHNGHSSHVNNEERNEEGHYHHRCENCLRQSTCKHKHIHQHYKYCCQEHEYGCSDCGKRFSFKDYAKLKHDTNANDIFEHPEWQHLNEYRDKHGNFTDPKQKPATTKVNKNVVPRSSVPTASRQMKTKSNGGFQETKPSTYSNPTNDLGDLVESVGLVMKDVYPDGNCLFTAICDQLRIRGDFSYTPRDLRHAAVDYLTEHPNQEDGTPLLAFLADDERNWDKYLNSMRRDGHWGDHFVIWALAHVLNRRIVIYRGNTELQKTIVEPTGPLRDTDRVKNQDAALNGSVGAAGGKEAPDKDIQDVQPLQNVKELYLGHVSQSHYVSLRSKDWHKNLFEVLKNKHTSCLIGSNPETKQVDHEMSLKFDVPPAHLAFAMKYVRMSEVIICHQQYKEGFSSTKSGNDLQRIEFYTEVLDAMNSSILGGEYREQFRTYVAYLIPTDTRVYNTESRHKARIKDLLLDTRTSSLGYTKLRAKCPLSWIKSLDGNSCLKHLQMNTSSEPTITRDMSMAFYCEWPTDYQEWLARKRIHLWPQREVLDVVKENGLRVVPESGSLCQSPVVEWKIVFDKAEQVITEHAVTEEQKDCFIIVKLLLENNVDNPFSLKQMKHVFFYMCEETEEVLWKTELATCVCMFLNRLKECLRCRNIPNYFVPGINLLEDGVTDEYVAQCIECIGTVQRHPFVALFFIFGNYSHIFQQINILFDRVIEDSNRYAVNKDINSSLRMCFLPLVAEGVCSLVEKNKYREALERCKIATEQLHLLIRDSKDVHLEDVIGQIILRSHRKLSQWLFAFHADLELGTFFTETVCERSRTASLYDYYGPSLADHLQLQTGDMDILIPFELVSLPNLAETTVYILEIFENSCNTDVCTDVLNYFASNHLGRLLQYIRSRPESALLAGYLKMLMSKIQINAMKKNEYTCVENGSLRPVA